jgi:hypothetical protein
MPERYRTRKLAAPLRRTLDLAAAIATEEILAAHVAQTLELIEIGAGRVAAPRMTDIYLRLHGLDGPSGPIVRTRVLAELGHRARSAEAVELTADDLPDGPEGPFRYLRERFRGRVHAELRRWVELHTGRSEVILLDIHIRNALVFVRTLGDDVPIREAVALYRERVGVHERLGDVLYWFVLARLGDGELPAARDVDTSELRIPPIHRHVSRRSAAARSPYRGA